MVSLICEPHLEVSVIMVTMLLLLLTDKKYENSPSLSKAGFQDLTFSSEYRKKKLQNGRVFYVVLMMAVVRFE